MSICPVRVRSPRLQARTLVGFKEKPEFVLALLSAQAGVSLCHAVWEQCERRVVTCVIQT